MFSLQVLHGCSLGLERLGLETVSRRFWNDSVSSRSYLETLTSPYRLGLGIIRLIYIELQSLNYNLAKFSKLYLINSGGQAFNLHPLNRYEAIRYS